MKRTFSLELIEIENQKIIDDAIQSHVTNESSQKTNLPIKKHPIQHLISSYLHFLMVMCFEIIFYFKYVTSYEKKGIYKMIETSMNGLLEDVEINQLTDSQRYNLDNLCNSDIEYKTNDNHNNALYINSLYIICLSVVFMIVLLIIESRIFNLKSTFVEDLKYSMLTVCFIAIFDYFFFVYFIMEYKIINQGELMCYLYENYEE